MSTGVFFVVKISRNTIIYKATIFYNGAIIFIAATLIKIGAELL